MVLVNNVINNKVGAANPGNTNTFTLINSSNTSSSSARETIIVGGASAGDASINFNINGITDWEIGADNSDSDSFVISNSNALGTNNYLRISTAGVHTLPKQPLFIAHKSNFNFNSTGDGTVLTVVYENVLVDQANNYNSTTGQFTAPVSGNYFISTSLFVSMLSSSHTIGEIDIIATGAPIGSNGILRGNFANIRCGADNSLSFTQGISYALTAGDVVTITLTVSGGTKTVACGGGLYSIFLIC